MATPAPFPFVAPTEAALPTTDLAVLCFRWSVARRAWAYRPAAGVTLSRTGAKSRTGGRKLRSTGTKAKARADAQARAREEMRLNIDIRLGLHELANQEGRDAFSFQLRYAKQQTERILLSLDNLIKNTIEKAPERERNFCLNRVRVKDNLELKHEEDKWERAMYNKWSPRGSDEFVSICKRIQTYQYPLQQHGNPLPSWGEVDLLGIGSDSLPVPIELKKRAAVESPLRMLVEMAAYGFAIRKVWPKLKDCWMSAIQGLGESRSQLPETLDKVTLIGVAPEEYWCQCLGLLHESKRGKFPPEAWPSFWKLVDAFGTYFVIYFVAVRGVWNNEDMRKLPTISCARVLDLRSISANPKSFGRTIFTS